MARSLCVIGCRLNGWSLIVIVAEGCSPAVLSALAVCLTLPNKWSINLTTYLLAWCICKNETLVRNSIKET
jgi:hypothetical protein